MQFKNFVGVFISASIMFTALGFEWWSLLAGWGLALMISFQRKDERNK